LKVAKNILPAAKGVHERTRNLSTATSLGLDRDTVEGLLVEKLDGHMMKVVEEKMTAVLAELVRKREEFRTEWKAAAMKVAKETAASLDIDLKKDNYRELRRCLHMVGLRRMFPGPKTRIELMTSSSETLAKQSLDGATTQLESRVDPARATALGIDLAGEALLPKQVLAKPLEAAIRSTIAEGYKELCDEVTKWGEERATTWARTKWLSSAGLLAAGLITAYVIGGTSFIFWGPTAGAAALLTFGFCSWRQSANLNKRP
jgi:hypothetical protein